MSTTKTSVKETKVSAPKAVKTPKTSESKVVTPKGPRGRPVIMNSLRQAKLEAQKIRLANGGKLEKGRPENPNSVRQLRIAERNAKLAAGIVIKRGAPKRVKEEAIAVA
jgi:hypothetical protein